MTQRIGQCVRTGDTFARLGGDEFVLLLPNPMPADVLATLIDRLARVVAKPVLLADREVSVTFSLGYSVYPQDGRDAITLLKRADAGFVTLLAPSLVGAVVRAAPRVQCPCVKDGLTTRSASWGIPRQRYGFDPSSAIASSEWLARVIRCWRVQ